ncbi:MAG: hypothetical protein HC800_23650 [Phormidesmis sp. RL_2_1]|nr:hypothetical protein [Phormidesmis sp. RL_2_1]
MKAQDFPGRLNHSLEELLSLTREDDTGSELEQQLGAVDAHWVQHGAYGIVEGCKRDLDSLLAFERGERQPTKWQQRYLIPSREETLDTYWPKINIIDEYYCSPDK